MSYNFSREYAKFDKEQMRIKSLLEKEGADKNMVEEILKMNKESFLSDMAYERHKADTDIDVLDMAGLLADRRGILEQVSVEYTRMRWLDEIENEKLYRCLKNMDDEDLKFIEEYAFSGITQRELGEKYGYTQSGISKRIGRIRGKIDSSGFRS